MRIARHLAPRRRTSTRSSCPKLKKVAKGGRGRRGANRGRREERRSEEGEKRDAEEPANPNKKKGFEEYEEIFQLEAEGNQTQSRKAATQNQGAKHNQANRFFGSGSGRQQAEEQK